MRALSLLCFIVALSCQPLITYAAEIEFLNSPEIRKLELPFSEAVRVGDTLYLSGQLGNILGTHKLIDGGIAAETEQTMRNISATLQRHGASLKNLVKCTIFLADMKEWKQMNEVYKHFFDKNYPARSAVVGSGLALGARVEIECIAALSDGEQ